MASETWQCRACDSGEVFQFLDLKEMPVTNRYPTKEDVEAFHRGEKKEHKYPLRVGMCGNCSMVQLSDFVPYAEYIVPDETGRTNYAFFSSQSTTMQAHFAQFAETIKRRFLNKGEGVAEIGGNDGIMLRAFDRSKYRVLNIEPSSNVAEISRSKGIETIESLFTPKLAMELLHSHGEFKVVSCANVLLNIHDINGVFEGARIMLSNNGVFITQDPYWPSVLKDTGFDQFYEEHPWCFSLKPLEHLAESHGMELFDAQLFPAIHGGSMRAYFSKKGAYEKTKRCSDYQRREQWANTPEACNNFASRVEKSKKNLLSILNNIKSQGKRIIGYAAASKGTVILNYCGIGAETLDYVVDSTPTKQGRYIPGVRIPIVSPEEFYREIERGNAPHYALLGARNYAKEIQEKEKEFVRGGGRFIVALPKPRIL